jgi:hypothetical protein
MHPFLGGEAAGLGVPDSSSTVHGGQDGFGQLVVVDRIMVTIAVRGISSRGAGEVMGRHRVFHEGEEDRCLVTSMGGGRR